MTDPKAPPDALGPFEDHLSTVL
jgi:hypothetical protein